MAAESPDKQRCAGCGATLAANLRYCVNCYRPVSGAKPARAHVETARQVETTHRHDPTVVFLPEVHEAMVRRSRRRKRALIVMATAVLIVAGAVAAWLALTHRSPEERRHLARGEMARRELRMMADALAHFRDDVGRYPTEVEGLHGLINRPAAFKPSDDARVNQWLGPYIERLPEVDPWGNDYVYEVTDAGRGFVLYSHGPGGETGSSGQFQVTSAETQPQ